MQNPLFNFGSFFFSTQFLHLLATPPFSSDNLFVGTRPAQLAELPRSESDPELFPHSAYVKFFVTFATKVPYLTFCGKMRQFFIHQITDYSIDRNQE